MPPGSRRAGPAKRSGWPQPVISTGRRQRIAVRLASTGESGTRGRFGRAVRRAVPFFAQRVASSGFGSGLLALECSPAKGCAPRCDVVRLARACDGPPDGRSPQRIPIEEARACDGCLARRQKARPGNPGRAYRRGGRLHSKQWSRRPRSRPYWLAKMPPARSTCATSGPRANASASRAGCGGCRPTSRKTNCWL